MQRGPILEKRIASLYESLWREVVNFCHHLVKILDVLVKAWDGQKYAGGLDNNNESFKDLQRLEERERKRKQGGNFLPLQSLVYWRIQSFQCMFT